MSTPLTAGSVGPPGRTGPGGPSGAHPSTRRSPQLVLLFGCAAVAVIEAVLLIGGRDISRAVPALLLLVPVVVCGLMAGRFVALAVALVATVGYSMLLPPFGSPRVELGHDLLALGLFVIVASVAGVLLSTLVSSDRRRLSAEMATVDALRQVDRDRAALLRSVSHDLRTPLATVRAAATDLRSFDHPRHVREELLDLVIDETERLDRIVGNLLSLSRIEAGALLPDRQPLDFSELVTDSIHRLRRVTDRVELEVSVDQDLPLVPGDYSQLDQVVANLVENAARHTPQGGRVWITVDRGTHGARLRVVDEGPGFDARVRDRLFEPFVGVGGNGSSGIGLAICRAIVEAHHGTIVARDAGASTGHRGAEIEVEVPIGA